jgi:hypothetical protein
MALILGGEPPPGWTVARAFDLSLLRDGELLSPAGSPVRLTDLAPDPMLDPNQLQDEMRDRGSAALHLLGYEETTVRGRGTVQRADGAWPWIEWRGVEIDPEDESRTPASGTTVLRRCDARWLFLTAPGRDILFTLAPLLPSCPPAESR